uniref:DUF6699 domain-containing protein n=1 Tax=Psilocybe cubensis TaxID=181762 RepID=A0A8H8CEV6_PSICU
MFTPPDSDDTRNMPPLVDTNQPFYPPPNGATNGGDPGFFDAFPGASGGGGGNPHSSPWAPPGHTPYPAHPVHLSPWSPQPASLYPTPPHSAPVGGWPYGGYASAGPPVWGPPPLASAGAAPGNPWGIGSGGGGQWAGGYTASPHPAFPGAAAGPSQPHSPYAAPGTPFDSSVGQPIADGWFGRREGGGGGGGGGGWGDNRRAWEAMGWDGRGKWDWDWDAEERHLKELKKEKKKKHRKSGEYGDDWDSWELLGWDLGGGSAMKRSSSHGPTQPHRRPSLHRSSSWGNKNQYRGQQYSPWAPNAHLDNGTPDYAQGDIFDENNLAKRPRDWRADYNPRPGLIPAVTMAMGAMGGLGRSRSTVKEFHDPIRRQIHPLFDLTDVSPALSFSLRAPPNPHSLSPPNLKFFRLSRPHNPIDLLQLATRPATPFMRLMHPKLPWYIDIHESRPNGVLVGDVLEQMHRQLHVSIRGRHYWNDVLGPEERREIARAFEERVRAYGEGEGMTPEEREREERERSVWADGAWGGVQAKGRERVGEVVKRGIIQVDFLGKKFWFEGLVRGPRGVWEIKTAAAD